MGGYLEYRGGVQYHGGYHDKCGDILSTVEGVQYRGGYHEYRGGVQFRGGYHDKCGDILSTVEGVQYRGGIS